MDRKKHSHKQKTVLFHEIVVGARGSCCVVLVSTSRMQTVHVWPMVYSIHRLHFIHYAWWYIPPLDFKKSTPNNYHKNVYPKKKKYIYIHISPPSPGASPEKITIPYVSPCHPYRHHQVTEMPTPAPSGHGPQFPCPNDWPPGKRLNVDGDRR